MIHVIVLPPSQHYFLGIVNESDSFSDSSTITFFDKLDITNDGDYFIFKFNLYQFKILHIYAYLQRKDSNVPKLLFYKNFDSLNDVNFDFLSAEFLHDFNQSIDFNLLSSLDEDYESTFSEYVSNPKLKQYLQTILFKDLKHNVFSIYGV